MPICMYKGFPITILLPQNLASKQTSIKKGFLKVCYVYTMDYHTAGKKNAEGLDVAIEDSQDVVN